jgi:squalene-hopene/tetraprenyl-beta-curcumene cyclase
VWKAGKWIASVQNEDGGWGESCASYNEGHFVLAPSTPSQTAWALLALMAAGEQKSATIARGIEYLVQTQQQDGTWNEDQFTGTGFPKYFMIKYHVYRNCFPLMAMGKYRSILGENG